MGAALESHAKYLIEESEKFQQRLSSRKSSIRSSLTDTVPTDFIPTDKKAIKEISERARSTNLDLPQVSKNVTSLLSTCSRFVCGSKPLTILGLKSYPQLAWDVEFGSLVVDQQLIVAYPLNQLMNQLYFSVKSFILPN